MAIERPGTVAPSSPRAEEPRFFYGYWIVVCAFLVQLIVAGTQTTITGAFLKPMSEELDWTRTEFMYVPTLGRFVMAAVGFWIGSRVDRYGGRRFMLVGAAIMGVTLFGTAEVQNLWQWVLLRGLAFMLGAAMVGNLIVNVTLSKWWVRRRGTMIGFAAMGVSAAGVLFPFLATTLIEELGWRAAWRILAVVSVVVLYPCALAMRRQPEDYGLHPDGLSDAQAAGAAGQQAASDYANSFTRAEALRTPALYLIVLAFAISSVGLSNMLLQTIPFLTDAGYTGSQAALYSGLMSFASLVSKPFWGWTTTRWEPKYAAAVGFVLAGSALMSVIHTAGMQASVPLAAGFAVIGLGFGSQIPLAETIWAAYFGRRYLGSVRGVALPLSFGLAAGSPLVVSWYFDRVGNYDGVFAFIAALWGVAAVVILFAKRPVKRTPPPEASPVA